MNGGAEDSCANCGELITFQRHMVVLSNAWFPNDTVYMCALCVLAYIEPPFL